MPLEPGWRNPFLILKVFIGFFLTLLGLGMLFRGDVMLGAVFAAAGLTFFLFLWLANRRSL